MSADPLETPSTAHVGYIAIGMLHDSTDPFCPWGMARSRGDPFVLFFLPPDLISIWHNISAPSSPHKDVSSYPHNFRLAAASCCNTIFIHTTERQPSITDTGTKSRQINGEYRNIIFIPLASHLSRANSRGRRQCSDCRYSNPPRAGLHMFQFNVMLSECLRVAFKEHTGNGLLWLANRRVHLAVHRTLAFWKTPRHEGFPSDWIQSHTPYPLTGDTQLQCLYLHCAPGVHTF
jgi:hypothetical protein